MSKMWITVVLALAIQAEGFHLFPRKRVTLKLPDLGAGSHYSRPQTLYSKYSSPYSQPTFSQSFSNPFYPSYNDMYNVLPMKSHYFPSSDVTYKQHYRTGISSPILSQHYLHNQGYNQYKHASVGYNTHNSLTQGYRSQYSTPYNQPGAQYIPHKSTPQAAGGFSEHYESSYQTPQLAQYQTPHQSHYLTLQKYEVPQKSHYQVPQYYEAPQHSLVSQFQSTQNYEAPVNTQYHAPQQYQATKQYQASQHYEAPQQTQYEAPVQSHYQNPQLNHYKSQEQSQYEASQQNHLEAPQQNQYENPQQSQYLSPHNNDQFNSYSQSTQQPSGFSQQYEKTNQEPASQLTSHETPPPLPSGYETPYNKDSPQKDTEYVQSDTPQESYQSFSNIAANQESIDPAPLSLDGKSVLQPYLQPQPSAEVSSSTYENHNGQATLVSKHIYFHVPPPGIEEPEPAPALPSPPPPPTKNINIIFIKTPSHETSNYAELIQQHLQSHKPDEEKTLIYVLVKKPDPTQDITLPPPPPPIIHKPEVFYIKYKTQKEGEYPQEIIEDNHNIQNSA